MTVSLTKNIDARRRLPLLLLAVALTGCGALQGAKNMVKATFYPTVDNLRITTRAESVTNADDRGAALPVTVRIYQLTDTIALQQTDYNGLLERDQEALGASLMQRFEYVAFPQSTSVQDIALKPGVRFIAVLAVMRKTPVPVYYLIDAAKLEESGITLKIDSQSLLVTAGPDPLNRGTQAAPGRKAVKPAETKGA